jgi:hypothetical protein
LLDSNRLIANYDAFKREFAAGRGRVKERQLWKQLEQKYGYSPKSVIQVLNSFVNCVDQITTVDIKSHATVDLALLKFHGFNRLEVNSFPLFAANGADLKQGKFLCRLGFPFPEFSNFEYDKAGDELRWTQAGRQDTPRFPIEGMVTRHLLDPAGNTCGFEMSTPGLGGQSGGPAFDAQGRIWGMQAATAHLDLAFDVNQEVLRDGVKKKVSDSAFLHVGHCVHVDVIKDFMRTHGVSFEEG